MDDTLSIVRVKQWVKNLEYLEPVSRTKLRLRVELDWDIGIVDENAEGYYIFGAPMQFFSSPSEGDGKFLGTPGKDARLLIETVELPTSSLTTASAVQITPDMLHFKYPNI